jgi:hypothetical protein
MPDSDAEGRQRGRPHRTNPRPPGPMEALRARAATLEQGIRQRLAEADRGSQRTRGRTARVPHQTQKRIGTILKAGLYQEWELRWRRLVGGKPATTWRVPWRPPATKTYDGLQKHEATAVFLLRTEVIGLKSWLYSVRVPGILP